MSNPLLFRMTGGGFIPGIVEETNRFQAENTANAGLLVQMEQLFGEGPSTEFPEPTSQL